MLFLSLWNRINLDTNKSNLTTNKSNRTTNKSNLDTTNPTSAQTNPTSAQTSQVLMQTSPLTSASPSPEPTSQSVTDSSTNATMATDSTPVTGLGVTKGRSSGIACWRTFWRRCGQGGDCTQVSTNETRWVRLSLFRFEAHTSFSANFQKPTGFFNTVPVGMGIKKAFVEADFMPTGKVASILPRDRVWSKRRKTCVSKSFIHSHETSFLPACCRSFKTNSTYRSVVNTLYTNVRKPPCSPFSVQPFLYFTLWFCLWKASLKTSRAKNVDLSHFSSLTQVKLP